MGTMADPPPLTEVADVVATRVKSLRVKSGWTQDEAAARLRAVGLAWGQAALSRFEKGGREPTVSELILLAAAFGTTPADLLHPAKDVTHVVLRSSGATGLKYGATVPAKALPGYLAGQGVDKIKAFQWPLLEPGKTVLDDLKRNTGKGAK